MSEKVKGYKTVAFFVLTLIIAVANLVGFGGFQLTSEQASIIAVVVPVVGLVLRYVTDGKIFNK